ncbi:MAG TPA: G1 family glutamic endopeptidase [Streptosporangiaceae bacterium]
MSIARFARPAAVVLALVLALALSAMALLMMNNQTHAAAGGPATTGGHAPTPETVAVADAVTGGGPVGVKHLRADHVSVNHVGRSTPLMSVSSQNWAGYVASSNRFRFVQARFAVPVLNCRKTPGTAKTPAMVGVWVGLDGLGGRVVTVEQDGIAGQCVRGVPTYNAWWEMFPKAPVYPAMVIHPRDVIQASVYYSSANRQYRLTLSDLSDGQGFSTWRRCGASSCHNGSAEVITEAPSVDVSSNRLFPLAAFGAVSYSRIQITDAAGQRGGFGSSLWQDTQLVMVDTAGHVKAATSGLSHGVAFKNAWERAN